MARYLDSSGGNPHWEICWDFRFQWGKPPPKIGKNPHWFWEKPPLGKCITGGIHQWGKPPLEIIGTFEVRTQNLQRYPRLVVLVDFLSLTSSAFFFVDI
jgi:hypothetical protein